jgi:hypothetical protein
MNGDLWLRRLSNNCYACTDIRGNAIEIILFYCVSVDAYTVFIWGGRVNIENDYFQFDATLLLLARHFALSLDESFSSSKDMSRQSHCTIYTS